VSCWKACDVSDAPTYMCRSWMPDAEDLGSASVASGADDVITDVEGTSAAPSHLHAHCKCHPSHRAKKARVKSSPRRAASSVCSTSSTQPSPSKAHPSSRDPRWRTFSNTFDAHSSGTCFRRVRTTIFSHLEKLASLDANDRGNIQR